MPRAYVNYIVNIKSIIRCVIIRQSNREVQSRQWKMSIISADILKIIDEWERCDTEYVAMRWSNSRL